MHIRWFVNPIVALALVSAAVEISLTTRIRRAPPRLPMSHRVQPRLLMIKTLPTIKRNLFVSRVRAAPILR
jgi:hypothetical protein